MARDQADMTLQVFLPYIPRHDPCRCLSGRNCKTDFDLIGTITQTHTHTQLPHNTYNAKIHLGDCVTPQGMEKLGLSPLLATILELPLHVEDRR